MRIGKQLSERHRREPRALREPDGARPVFKMSLDPGPEAREGAKERGLADAGSTPHDGEAAGLGPEAEVFKKRQ